MRFGIFLPPMHKTGTNPTLNLHRDLDLVSHLDRLGYHEAWIGEHHSAGSRWVDATLGAQLTEIATYEAERAARTAS